MTPPLSAPGLGFQHLEVPQLVVAPDGRRSIVFSAPTDMLSHAAQERGLVGGIWAMGVGEPETLRLLAPQNYYSGRVIRDRAGADHLMVVLNVDSAGEFPGEISDPIPLAFRDGIPYLHETAALPL